MGNVQHPIHLIILTFRWLSGAKLPGASCAPSRMEAVIQDGAAAHGGVVRCQDEWAPQHRNKLEKEGDEDLSPARGRRSSDPRVGAQSGTSSRSMPTPPGGADAGAVAANPPEYGDASTNLLLSMLLALTTGSPPIQPCVAKVIPTPSFTSYRSVSSTRTPPPHRLQPPCSLPLDGEAMDLVEDVLFPRSPPSHSPSPQIRRR